MTVVVRTPIAVPHTYAVIPAAGRSTRMGRPKLLLPWRDGTIIDQILSVWAESPVDQIIIVVRQDDVRLQQAVRRWPVHLVRPVRDPADMKESVLAGLQFIHDVWRPSGQDQWFMAPADLPGLDVRVMDRLLAMKTAPGTIRVPRFGRRSGHPILMPFSVADRIRSLPPDAGIDRLIAEGPCAWLPLPAEERIADMDTPDDYRSAHGLC